MRKLFVLLALLLGSLFAAQSAMAATARYSECCMDDCSGLAQCVSMSCQVCAAPAALPAEAALLPRPMASSGVCANDDALPPAPLAEIWNPPD